MRITVSIDDETYEAAQRIAFESRRTLGEAINELLAEGLRITASRPARRRLGQLRGTIAIADDFNDTSLELLD